MAKIALGRYNATVSPRKGAVFVNPGGPGGPGVLLATQAGQLVQKLVSVDPRRCSLVPQLLQLQIGEDWDVIGFDPRGIGLSEYVVPYALHE